MNNDITSQGLLAAALPHVPFDGWSTESFQRACDDLKVDHGMFGLLFPEGIAQAIELFLGTLDAAMEAELKTMPLAQMKVREKISAGVLSVFKQAQPHKEALYQATRFLAKPQHAPRAATCLYHTVDSIWYAIGDTSTDFNFYTKRATLAGVFSSTAWVWLEDESDDMAKTRAFLAKRIDDVMKIEKAKAMVKSWLPKQWRSA